MKKALIISAHPGMGKTFLGRKYKNILDLESSDYKWIYSKNIEVMSCEQRKAADYRELNSEWPQNYMKAIEKNMYNYDYILIASYPLILDYLDSINFQYILATPTIESKEIYMKRYKDRGNRDNWIEGQETNWEEYVIQKLERPNVEKIILKDNETLEDYFIKSKYKLVKK